MNVNSQLELIASASLAVAFLLEIAVKPLMRKASFDAHQYPELYPVALGIIGAVFAFPALAALYTHINQPLPPLAEFAMMCLKVGFGNMVAHAAYDKLKG